MEVIVVNKGIVTFDNHVKTLSGKDSEKKYVYYAIHDGAVCCRRAYVRPTITERNHESGAKFKRIGLLYREVTEAFKESLRKYAQAYNEQLLPALKLPVNEYNIFTKALCRDRVSLGDLESIKRFSSLYGWSVAEWMACGLLDRVRS